MTTSGTSLFTQKLARRLALSFGHIAHFDCGCFYNHFFLDLQGKVAFLEETLAWVPCGEPSHTFCDVERAGSHGCERATCLTHTAHCARRRSREWSGLSLRSFARNMKARPAFTNERADPASGRPAESPPQWTAKRTDKLVLK